MPTTPLSPIVAEPTAEPLPGRQRGPLQPQTRREGARRLFLRDPVRPAVIEEQAEVVALSSLLKGHPVLWVLLALFFTIATIYNLVIPIGEAPDEVDHIQYVEVLSATAQLPTIPMGSPRFSFEAEQPPLYYLVQAAWMRLIWPGAKLLPNLPQNPAFSYSHMDEPANAYLHQYPASDAVPAHLMRLISTLFGAGLLYCIWLAARYLWPGAIETASIATGFAALLPGATFSFGTVSNDSLAALLGAATLLALLVASRQGVTVRGLAAAGLLLGLGILSKRSLLVMLPLLFLVPAIMPAATRKTRLAAMTAGVCIALATGAWPFVHNFLNYGDPFATALMEQVKKGIDSPLADIPGFWLLPAYVTALFNSLWGVFGLRSLELPYRIYDFYYVICGVALLGILYHYQARRAGKHDRRIVLVLVATLFLIYAGVAYQNTQFWALQGRLLLPGFAALSLLVGHGLTLLLRQTMRQDRARYASAAALLIVLLLINGYALIWRLVPAYYH